jgi:hypothetical protein
MSRAGGGQAAGPAARPRAARLQDVVREYTAGMSGEELRRLFGDDAARAYDVLVRDQETRGAPGGRVRRVFWRAKLLFFGLSAKLSPGRRLLFAAALGCAVFGFIQAAEHPPGLLVLAVLGLVYLLAMELVDRVLVRDELQVARQLQRELLPLAPPEVDGWRFAHSYRTANEVGGDYFSYVPLADGRLALAVGDASGHGIAAGLLMAIANATLQTGVELDPSPVEVTALVNRVLCRTGDRRAFLSLFYALLDPASGALEYVCAGHPFPLLRRAGGAIDELGSGSLPLGIRSDLAPRPARTQLAPGDLLLLYTDGLPEATVEEKSFGFDRLRALLAEGGGAEAVHDRVAAAFAAYTAGQPLGDDLTLIAVERLARDQVT